VIASICLLLFQTPSNAADYTVSTINDTKIAYTSFGSGEPIFILNGGPRRQSKHFESVARSLSSLGFKAILFDQRGTGQSTLKNINRSTVTLDNMVEDLEALRNHLGFKKIILFGHSFGGIYAASYAQRYPNYLAVLIFSAAPALDLKWLKYFMANVYSRIDLESRIQHKYLTSSEYSKKNPIKAKTESITPLLPAYL